MNLLKIALLLPMFSAFASSVEGQKMSNTKTRKIEKPSGLFGTVALINTPPIEDAPGGLISDCDVIILSAKNGREVKRARTNSWGGWSIELPPGKYIVFPKHPKGQIGIGGDEKAVTVWRGFKTEVYATFDGGW